MGRELLILFYYVIAVLFELYVAYIVLRIVWTLLKLAFGLVTYPPRALLQWRKDRQEYRALMRERREHRQFLPDLRWVKPFPTAHNNDDYVLARVDDGWLLVIGDEFSEVFDEWDEALEHVMNVFGGAAAWKWQFEDLRLKS